MITLGQDWSQDILETNRQRLRGVVDLDLVVGPENSAEQHRGCGELELVDFR